ncbi:MAG: PorV/PorQ family protein [Ignavibacteriales bacterium]|nr:PorV/PorQ family protein [Ignavibacteriales bacterium]
MNRRIAGLMILCVLLVAQGVQAQSKVGTTAAQFLGISVGAQAAAMGDAFVASKEGVSTIYWNPGAFAASGRSELMFANTNWLVGTKFRWFGFMLNLDGTNAVGVSLTNLNYGEEDVTTVLAPDGTGERWTAQDIALALSYSRRLTDRFSMGGSIKYVSQTLWNESASTIAFDLGLLFETGFNDMRLGMSFSNFGGDMTMDGRDLLQRVDIDPANSGSNKTLVGKLKTDAWPIPLFFRVGVAMDVIKSNDVIFTLAADAVRPNDNVEYVNVGGELGWNKLIRGGYRSLFKTAAEEGLTLGAGVRYQFEGIATMEVNYAYSKFGVFGNLNTIAMAVSF